MQRQENQKSKVILVYTVRFRPAWATWDHAGKERNLLNLKTKLNLQFSRQIFCDFVMKT